MEQTEQKLFKEMTAEEQSKWLTDFTKFNEDKLPLLEQLGDAWEVCHVKDMEEGLRLLFAFSSCRDFVRKSFRYGDYSARVKRLEFYMNLLKKQFNEGKAVKGINGNLYAIAAANKIAKRRGRPASAETIALREAEAKAAQQQTALFGDGDGSASQSPRNNETTVVAPFIAPATRDDLEYKLSIAQKRAFLSPDVQKLADQIRALRTTAGAAAEKAKTMAELKASPELIAPVAEEAQRTLEQVEQIYAEIDRELAEVWYRLQNGSPEWKTEWMKRFGFKSYDDLHADLIHDLRHHYKKVTERQPDFETLMRQRIEQESPEYIAHQAEEAARKKEIQDILRYLKRKDKGISEQRVKTSREKFARLQELLGKKEAADYRPLLTKIEDDYKAAKKAAKDKTTN